MVQWKTNVRDLVKKFDTKIKKFKQASSETFLELAKMSYEHLESKYVRAGKMLSSGQYAADSTGDVHRFTKRRTLSKANYFDSKAVRSRTGDYLDSLKDAQRAKGFRYRNENVGFDISPEKINIYATSEKAAALDRKRAAGGSKNPRYVTKKTWGVIIRFWNKTMRTKLKGKL